MCPTVQSRSSRWSALTAPAAALALGLLILTTACGGTSTGSGQLINLGGFAASTGALNAFGLYEQQGMELAVKDINDAGGVLGRKLNLTYEDTASDKTQAQSIMQNFVSDSSIVAVVGPTSSAEAFAADPAAMTAKLPVIAISDNSDGVPQIGPYLHRISIAEAPLDAGVVDQTLNALNYKKVAIMYAQTDPFATSGFKAFQAELQKQKVTITEVVPYDPTNPDLTPQLRKIKGENPDAVFVAAYGDDGATILRQAAQVGLKVPFIGNAAFNSPKLIAAAGDAANGLIIGTQWDASDNSGNNGKFLSEYKKAYNRDAGNFAAMAYNGVYLVKMAIEKSGDASRAGVQKGFLELDGYTLLGSPVKFVDIGNGLRDSASEKPIMLQVQNGTLQPMKVS